MPVAMKQIMQQIIFIENTQTYNFTIHQLNMYPFKYLKNSFNIWICMQWAEITTESISRSILQSQTLWTAYGSYFVSVGAGKKRKKAKPYMPQNAACIVIVIGVEFGKEYMTERKDGVRRVKHKHCSCMCVVSVLAKLATAEKGVL